MRARSYLVIPAILWWMGCGGEPVKNPAQNMPMPAAAVPVMSTGVQTSATIAVPPPHAGNGPVARREMPSVYSEEKARSRYDGMNEAIRSYRKDNETYPKTLEDLVKAGYITRVPPAPSGKRYEIDPKTGVVSLINQ